MKLRINVTKEIIEKAKHCSIHSTISKNCAIALAIRALFPFARVQSAWVNLLGFNIGAEILSKDNLLADAAPLPLIAMNFIKEFDSTTIIAERLKIKPISFEIVVPDYVLQQIDITDAKDVDTMQLVP